MSEEKQERQEPRLVSQAEEEKVCRRIVVWLNTCPECAGKVSMLAPGVESFTAVPGDDTRVLEQNIIGGYTAEFTALVVYRIRPGDSIDRRLRADELLERIGMWALENPPDLGAGITAQEVMIPGRASTAVQFENGDEDHQINISVRYYVPPAF